MHVATMKSICHYKSWVPNGILMYQNHWMGQAEHLRSNKAQEDKILMIEHSEIKFNQVCTAIATSQPIFIMIKFKLENFM